MNLKRLLSPRSSAREMVRDTGPESADPALAQSPANLPSQTSAPPLVQPPATQTGRLAQPGTVPLPPPALGSRGVAGTAALQSAGSQATQPDQGQPFVRPLQTPSGQGNSVGSPNVEAQDVVRFFERNAINSPRSISSRRGFVLEPDAKLALDAGSSNPKSPPMSPRSALPLSPKSVKFQSRENYLDAHSNIVASRMRNAPHIAFMTKRLLDRLCRELASFDSRPEVSRAPKVFIEISALYTRSVSQAVAQQDLASAGTAAALLCVAVRTFAERFRAALESTHVAVPAHIGERLASVTSLLERCLDLPPETVRSGSLKKTSARTLLHAAVTAQPEHTALPNVIGSPVATTVDDDFLQPPQLEKELEDLEVWRMHEREGERNDPAGTRAGPAGPDETPKTRSLQRGSAYTPERLRRLLNQPAVAATSREAAQAFERKMRAKNGSTIVHTATRTSDMVHEQGIDPAPVMKVKKPAGKQPRRAPGTQAVSAEPGAPASNRKKRPREPELDQQAGSPLKSSRTPRFPSPGARTRAKPDGSGPV